MGYRTVLWANLKKHRGGLSGIFLLTWLAAAALGTILTVWHNYNAYISEEMQRAGYGALTVWVSKVPAEVDLTGSMEALPQIDRVETQKIIYTNYTVREQESDSEGQWILYRPEEKRYRFFKEDLSGYCKQPDAIAKGEVYVSPAMISMFGITIGDTVVFPIARSGRSITLTVKGFYEDPFMGSSMIGMKGFLVSEADRAEALALLQNAGIDALARDGAMLHIFPAAKDFTAFALNSLLNEQTAIGSYSESVHSREAILGFMVILQNAFAALLLAFVIVLLFVVLVVISYSVSSTVEADTVNMGILKTIGFTKTKLWLLAFCQYLIPTGAGMLCGLVSAVWLSGLAGSMTLTTTGVRMPTALPAVWITIAFTAVLLFFMLFILLRTEKIARIKPMQAIRSTSGPVHFRPEKTISAVGKGLYVRLALRQLLAGKHRYMGALAVAVLLVFFASVIGRMDTWLGADGKGMMDAFNPADHDIGVQSFGSLTQEEFESTIRTYTDITDTYVLAMPTVAVNGVNYTANVIDQPERFHILEGQTCRKDNEVVLTEFVAAHFGIRVGDTVTVRADSGSGSYVVSGIYSCANDMGDNIGMSRAGYLKIGRDHPNLWCWHYFLADSEKKAEITAALENAYGGDIHVHENTWPGLFGIIAAMQALMGLMYGTAAVFILVVTMMTGSKILAAEQKDLSIYQIIGSRISRLRLTFALRFGMTALIGAVIGLLAADALTDDLVSAVLKLAGISNFASAPSAGSILLPAAAVVLLFTGFAYLAAGKIKKINIAGFLKE